MCVSRTGTFYHRHVAPLLVHGGCSMSAFTCMRQRVLRAAEGTVVVVGFGSGLNLPQYDPGKVKQLVGIDPHRSMLAIAQREMTRGGESRMHAGRRGKHSARDRVSLTLQSCPLPLAKFGGREATSELSAINMSPPAQCTTANTRSPTLPVVQMV